MKRQFTLIVRFLQIIFREGCEPRKRGRRRLLTVLSHSWVRNDVQSLRTSASTLCTVAPVVFSDEFNRVDSSTVSNGWMEQEQSGTDLTIVGSQLRLSTASTGGHHEILKSQWTFAVALYRSDENKSRHNFESSVRLFFGGVLRCNKRGFRLRLCLYGWHYRRR